MRVEPTPLVLPDDINAAIEAHWAALKLHGHSFFRGATFTVTSVRHDTSGACLTLALSDYAHYLYTVDHNLPSRHALRVAYTSCLMHTRDGQFVLGEMAGHTSSPGRLQLPGGNLDLHDRRGEHLDAVHSVVNEVCEEVGVPLDANDVRARYVKSGGTHDFIGLIFTANVPLDADQLRMRFEQHNHELERAGQKPELHDLAFVPANLAGVRSHFELEERPQVDYLQPVLERVARDEPGS